MKSRVPRDERKLAIDSNRIHLSQSCFVNRAAPDFNCTIRPAPRHALLPDGTMESVSGEAGRRAIAPIRLNEIPFFLRILEFRTSYNRQHSFVTPTVKAICSETVHEAALQSRPQPPARPPAKEKLRQIAVTPFNISGPHDELPPNAG